MVTKANERGSYRYTPRDMTEQQFKEKLETLVLLISKVCIPDEIRRAKDTADRRWRHGKIR